MNGTEIIELINNNLSTILTAVGPVVASVFTAIFLRKDTSVKEFEKVKAGHFQEVADDLLSSGKMTYTEYYKANNFLSVAQKADEFYASMPHNNPAAQYNFDWFIRFYDAVGNISNSEMQDIWAKILAGEIDHPSTYSLRTIDILKNMSKEEALLFTKVCQHCVGNGDVLFLPHYDDYLERCGLTFSEVMYLDELGLINSNGMLILKMPVSTEPKVAFINSDYIVMIQAEEVDKTLTIKQFPLTDVGNEIATLVSGNLADEDFLFFAEKIRGQAHIKVSAHKINYIEANGNINYQLADVLTSIKQENQ